MDFYDFFYPEQSQARSLRRIANSLAERALADPSWEELVRENQQLRACLSALAGILIRKNVLTQAELQAEMSAAAPPSPMAAAIAVAVDNDDDALPNADALEEIVEQVDDDLKADK